MSLFGCHKGSVLSAAGRSGLCVDERRFVMLYAAIDIHKHAFQAAVLDPGSGEVVEERLALGLARAGRQWFRGAAGGAGADARFARPPPQRQDRSARCALAGTPAREGDAAAVLDPARADPAAARSHAAAQGAGRGPAPLGSAPARLPLARGLALLAVEPAQAAGATLGGRPPAARARSPAGRLALGGDGGA